MNKPYVHDMTKMNQTGISYSQFIQNLLKSQPDATVITVLAKDMSSKTGSIMDRPSTSVDGEDNTQEGRSLDGPDDNDQLRRRKIMHYWRDTGE